MAEPWLTFWPDAVPGQPGEAKLETLADHRQAFHLKLLDADEQEIGKLQLEEPEPIWVETFAPDGTAGWVRSAQPVSLDLAESHPTARYALVQRGLESESLRIELASDRIARPTVWDGSAPIDVPRPILLIAEQFDQPERFWQACAEFQAALMNTAPFNDYLDAGKLGIIGLWWEQDAQGLFDTRYHQKTRRMFGDQARAQRYADSVKDDAIVIVLIDSNLWAGAGGQLFKRPAWASIYNFGYGWADMALHELGHSFGLQDEYVAEGPKIEYNPRFFNVTNQSDAADCIWATERSPGITHNPTQNSAGQPPHDPDVIGTFQGALYHETKYYRPSADCRMREVTAPFCPICIKAISHQLDKL